MLTASLRLSGTLSDGAEAVRSYYLVADFGEHGGGKSSIIPLSLGAPMPDDDHLTVKALPGNQGLEMRVAINPE